MTKNNPLVSIIVPVYNVEKYIEECLDSLINQTYKNIEIIIVNDGSPDGSLKICERYAKKDDRIKIISKDNAGLNMARKTGFDNSTGGWITFVDSDDVLNRDCIKLLHNSTIKHNVDIAIGGFKKFTEKTPQDSDDSKSYIIESNEVKRRYLADIKPENNIFWQTAWGKLFKRDIIDSVDWNTSNYRYNEDEIMSIFFYYNLKRAVSIVQGDIYYYRQSSNSIMSMLNKEYINFYDGRKINRLDFLDSIVKLRINYFGEMFSDEIYFNYSHQFIVYIKSRYDIDKNFKIPNRDRDKYNSIIKYLIKSEKRYPYYDVYASIFKYIKRAKNIEGFFDWVKSNPLISIIVPVYNSEKYLRECLDSILWQTYRNIEIIVVNDGSTDKSVDICQEYAQNNYSIKYVQKKNEGVSSARNIGIKEANGEYLSFVDSDDFLEINGIEKLVNYICSGDNDIILGNFASYHTVGYRTIDSDRDTEIGTVFNMRTSPHVTYSMLNKENSPWAKLFKKQFIIENNIKFPIDLRIAEDLVFVAKSFFLADKIILAEDVVYNYRQDFDNNHSAIGKVDKSKALDFYKALIEIKRFLASKGFLSNREVDNAFKNTVMQHSLYNLQISEKDSEVHKIIFDKIHNNIFKEFNINKGDIQNDQQLLGFIYDGDYDKCLIYRLNEMKNYALNRVDAVAYLEGKIEESNDTINALNGKIKYQESVRYFIKYPLMKTKRIIGKIIRKVKVLIAS